jgi:hypothetical protein
LAASTPAFALRAAAGKPLRIHVERFTPAMRLYAKTSIAVSNQAIEPGVWMRRTRLFRAIEWGGTAPGGLATVDDVRNAVLSGAIKSQNTLGSFSSRGRDRIGIQARRPIHHTEPLKHGNTRTITTKARRARMSPKLFECQNQILVRDLRVSRGGVL